MDIVYLGDKSRIKFSSESFSYWLLATGCWILASGNGSLPEARSEKPAAKTLTPNPLRRKT